MSKNIYLSKNIKNKMTKNIGILPTHHNNSLFDFFKTNFKNFMNDEICQTNLMDVKSDELYEKMTKFS